MSRRESRDGPLDPAHHRLVHRERVTAVQVPGEGLDGHAHIVAAPAFGVDHGVGVAPRPVSSERIASLAFATRVDRAQ